MLNHDTSCLILKKNIVMVDSQESVGQNNPSWYDKEIKPS